MRALTRPSEIKPKQHMTSSFAFKLLTYAVECDFRPFQRWILQAESESEARLALVALAGVPYEETSASLYATLS